MFFTMSNERDIKAYSLQKEANSCIIKFNQENPKGINNANFNFNDLHKKFPKYSSFSITVAGDSSNQNRMLNRAVEQILFNSIIGAGFRPFFLPANRTFFPAYYKYVYTAAKEEIDLMNTTRHLSNESSTTANPNASSPFTKPLNRLVKQMFDLGKQSKANDYYKDLLLELKELIGGDIEHQSTAGLSPVEFKLKYNEGKELDMYLSSSSSNQLATLFLYLKYWAGPANNFLFIDEPEENLHPANQIKLINILMKFANMNNNRILITTHSPLMSEAINNYMHIAHLKEIKKFSNESISEIEGDLDFTFDLKQRDFGLYFFNGNTIKEYAINSYGTLFKEFKSIENRMKKISSLLKNHIYEAEND